MTENKIQPQKEHPALEALLWLTPLVGEIKDLKEICQNERKNLLKMGL